MAVTIDDAAPPTRSKRPMGRLLLLPLLLIVGGVAAAAVWMVAAGLLFPGITGPAASLTAPAPGPGPPPARGTEATRARAIEGMARSGNQDHSGPG